VRRVVQIMVRTEPLFMPSGVAALMPELVLEVCRVVGANRSQAF